MLSQYDFAWTPTGNLLLHLEPPHAHLRCPERPQPDLSVTFLDWSLEYPNSPLQDVQEKARTLVDWISNSNQLEPQGLGRPGFSNYKAIVGFTGSYPEIDLLFLSLHQLVLCNGGVFVERLHLTTFARPVLSGYHFICGNIPNIFGRITHLNPCTVPGTQPPLRPVLE